VFPSYRAGSDSDKYPVVPHSNAAELPAHNVWTPRQCLQEFPIW